MNKAEIHKRVEEFLDNLLIEVEPEETEETAEQVRAYMSEYLDATIAMQQGLDTHLAREKKEREGDEPTRKTR